MLINYNAAESNGGEKKFFFRKKEVCIKLNLKETSPFLMGVYWESTGNPEKEAKL